MNLSIAGDDPVAVDTILCHITGVDPNDVLHIQFAAEMGLGTMDMRKMEILGEKVDRVKRRFKMADEDTKKIQIPGFQMLMSEKSCTGCRATMYSVLKDMEMKGLMDHLKGLKVIVGEFQEELPPDIDKKNLVLVGACTAKKRKEFQRSA